MKNNNHNLDLEQLLADVEHAGRDARRREQLAAMIDEMGATESSKHGFWWWSARVAAAACVLFFISTAVRVWFMPTESAAPIIAEADIPTPPTPAAIDSTIAPTTPRHNILRSSPKSVEGDKSSALVEEYVNIGDEPANPDIMEYLAEAEVSDTMPAEEDTHPSPLATLESPSPSLREEQDSPDSTEPTTTTLAQATTETEPQARPRRSLLANFFRQPEPDNMTGTVLAFRIL